MRKKDYDWNCGDPDKLTNIDQAQLATLMDLRDELKKLNAVFACINFQDIPNILRGIRKKLPNKKRKKKVR